VTASTSWQKEAIYKNILREKILYEDISESRYLTNDTNHERLYDIKKRIEMFRYADTVLEEAYKGKFLRWNTNRSNILLTNGMKIRSTIKADYLLVVPLENIKDEKMYFFMYQTNKQASKMEPIKLHIFSVFSDRIDFTGGQDKSYTILETSKYHIKSRTLTTIYTKPSYAKSKTYRNTADNIAIVCVK
jgi:hypothetical protein